MGKFKSESGERRDMGGEDGRGPDRHDEQSDRDRTAQSNHLAGEDTPRELGEEPRQGPTPPSTPYETEPDPRDGLGPALRWLRTTDSAVVGLARDVVVSLLVVVAVGLLLYAISGVWPPLVAVESDSMDPHLQKGDLVLVVENGRFAPEFAAGDTGVVTAETGAEHDYYRFGGPGDVIVYQPNGIASTTPIIHRAHHYVETDENWYDRADPAIVDADSCDGLAACPAPSTGFITKGDNEVTNDYYDQERGISTVVEPEWVRGRAVLRIPWLGWIRLAASDLTLPGLSAVSFPLAAGLIARR